MVWKAVPIPRFALIFHLLFTRIFFIAESYLIMRVLGCDHNNNPMKSAPVIKKDGMCIRFLNNLPNNYFIFI